MDVSEAVKIITIAEAEAGLRLDRVLARAVGGVSRTRLAALIGQGHVVREGASETLVEPSTRVKPGERYRLVLPPPVPASPAAQQMPLAIVYEDDQLIVVDKPAGLVVHPAPGNPDRTLVNALIAHCGSSLSGIGGTARPGIVHRLDKDTSGLIVAAKTDAAHQALARQFASHGRDGQLHRLYLAFAQGVPSPRKGVIEAAIARDPHDRKAFAIAARGGKHAVTHFETRRLYGRPPAASLIACRLETGRTHQIRVHLAHIGHPLLGDSVYGRRRTAARLYPRLAPKGMLIARQALHAAELGFVHPVSFARLFFQSPLPADLQELEGYLERL